MKTILLADTEYFDDVRVVKIGSNLGFALKSFQMLLVEERLPGQHFDRHAALQGFLLRLENHAHAATSDFADDSEIAQPRQLRRAQRGTSAAGLFLPRLQALSHGNGRKQLADFLRQFRVLLRIFLYGWTLALPQPLHKFSSQQFQRIAFGMVGTRHVMPRRSVPALAPEFP